ncbi:MAG: sensor domain-containing diguanylate cyclase [Vicinamibacterales bacterium]
MSEHEGAALNEPTLLQDRVDAYASWVRTLRTGHHPPTLPIDPTDPLARLGRELELLSVTLNQREAELRGLLDLVQTVERGILLDDVLSKIFEAFKGLIPFDRIGCAFLSDNGRDAVSYWERTELGPVQLERGYGRPLAGSSLQQILSTRQPRILNDLEAYLRAKPDSDATRRIVSEGGRASLTCPLIIDDRPLGFLFFTSREKGVYDDTHQSIFQQISHQVAAVLAKSQVYERLVADNRVLLERTRDLQTLADVDPLTGALTRRAIDGRLERTWKEHVERGTPFGVALLDIDHFKTVNDTYGHAAGDAVLREVVRRVADQLRKGDVCGRYGGEEFLVVVADTTEDQLLQTAERLRGVLAAVRMGVAHDIPVTASFGLAHTTRSPSSWAALVQRADEALYEAKRAGRNQCVVAAEE